MNEVSSIEILTESAPGIFIAEYLMSKTIYSVNCIDFRSFKDSDNKNKKCKILLIDASIPLLSECLKRESIFTKYFAAAIFNLKKVNSLCSYSIRQGIKGIFYYDEDMETIMKGVLLLTEGKIRISRDLLYKAVYTKDDELFTKLLKTNMTHREIEILLLIKEGFMNKEIAEKLFISLYTVKKHISNIFNKIGITSRKEARDWCCRKTENLFKEI
ncbi:MAG: response regulator transcription factor [Spirochaetes bacterium]|nr:response regulator transcription factor [Spirochaetota bacterium]